MKTLGTILIVTGLLVSIIGYGEYTNVMCHRHAILTGHFLVYHCESLQHIGHTMMYLGLIVVGSGIILFVQGWRKKIILN